MRWVRVDRIHINTYQVQSFHWIDGRLYIRYGGNDVLTFRDPNQERYIRLCSQLGVIPNEEVPNDKD